MFMQKASMVYHNASMICKLGVFHGCYLGVTTKKLVLV